MTIDTKITFANAQHGVLLPSEHPLRVDEKVWRLTERDDLINDRYLRRVQAIHVYRDGKLVEFARVLGPSSRFSNSGFTILSLNTESVGRIMEMAEKLRNDNGLQRAMDDHAEEFEGDMKQAIRRDERARDYIKRNPRTIRSLHR